jgi:hypothetical protein
MLYVDRAQGRRPNLRSSVDTVTVYAGCASLLAASARAAGESFTVVTNSIREVRSATQAGGFAPFPCVEIAFALALPGAPRFAQAHRKLSVLEAMGSGALGSFVGLMDIDVVLQGPLSARLGQAPGLHAYALDASLAGGRPSDIELLIGRSPAPHQWYGGEFIAGDRLSIGRLAAACRSLLPRYLKVLPRLLHVGDETVVSAALNLLEQDGVPIRELGAERIVARWHGNRLPVVQQTLAQALDAIVLHLPSDKLFLQAQARKPFAPDRFRQDLVRHARAKSLLRSLANPFLDLAEGRHKFPPQVGNLRVPDSRRPISIRQAGP